MHLLKSSAQSSASDTGRKEERCESTEDEQIVQSDSNGTLKGDEKSERKSLINSGPTKRRERKRISSTVDNKWTNVGMRAEQKREGESAAR